MKKIFLSILALALVLSNLVFAVSANEALTIEVESVQVCRGDEFEVDIVLKDNPGFSSVLFSINYDTEALDLVEISRGQMLDGASITDPPSFETGCAFLAYKLATISQDGILGTLKFKANSDADFAVSDITITNIQILDIDGEFIDYNLVNGSVEVYDPEGAILRVADKNAFCGREVTVTVNVENNPGMTVLGFELGYDASVMTLIDSNYYTVGQVFSEDSFFPYDPTATVKPNPYHVTFMNKLGDALENDNGELIDIQDVTNNGELISFKFLVDADAPEGSYPVTVKAVEAYNFDEEYIHFTGLTGLVNIKAVEPGDVTGDGRINSADLLLLAKYIARWDVEIVEAAADVKPDNKINSADLLLLAKYIARWDVTLG